MTDMVRRASAAESTSTAATAFDPSASTSPALGSKKTSTPPSPATRPSPLKEDARATSSLGGPIYQTTSRAQDLARKVTGPPADTNWYPEYEVKWDGPEDPENPYNWSTFKRWYTVVLGGLLVLNCSFASSAPSENIPSYEAEFGISSVVGALTISLFLCGYIAGPLLWGPLSETYGRRNVFLISFFPYVMWNVGCALSKNIGSLLVFRFLAGTFAAAPLSNSGALVSDVLPARTRGIGMSVFSLAPFAGPAIGPLVGGFIEVTGTSWRWTYWVLTIFAGSCFVAVVFSMPETYTPLLLQRKARKLRRETGDARYWAPLDKKSTKFKALAYNVLLDPFKMLFEEPMLLAITVYLSFIYGIIYAQFSSVPIIFSGVHGFSAGVTGLTFLSIFLGGVIGNLIYVFYFAPQYAKKVDAHAPSPVPPEARLTQAMVGAILLPISFFWVSWTGNYRSVSYWAPLIGTGVLGMAVLMAFLALFNYIVDAYLARAATAFAINTVVRSAAAASFPLFTPQMYHALGINWAGTLLGCLALLGVPLPFVLYKYGPKIRAMSKNAPTPPPKPAPRDEEEGVAEKEKTGAP